MTPTFKEVFLRAKFIYSAHDKILGACHAIDLACREFGVNEYKYTLEFEKQKPANCNSLYWWPIPDRQARIEAFDRAIKGCEE